MSFNRITLGGRLAKDPESKTLKQGTNICTFSIPDNQRRGKNKEEATIWFRVTTFGKLAEICTQYLVKGKEVVVMGELRTDEWEDRDGKNRTSLEINAQDVFFVGSNTQAKPAEPTPAPPLEPDPDDMPF